MNAGTLHLLLADDDKDDCLFFEEVLDELQLSTHLTVVHDGEQLMGLLSKETAPLPDVLFLDLNIPCKNGIECLSEIKANKMLKTLSVIIISTSSEPDILNRVFSIGAHHYIRKPAEFTQLKKVIHQALMMITENQLEPPSKERFVLTGNP